MVGRVIDSLIVFRILKLLTTDFKKMPAYKFGFIDKNGKRIKFLPDPNNKNQLLPNEPKTKEEKNSLTPLHRLIFNLKKLIRMVPFGKTAFASYAVALALLKEQSKLDAEQTEQLFEDFYKLLKDTETFEPDMLSEATEVGKLCGRRGIRSIKVGGGTAQCNADFFRTCGPGTGLRFVSSFIVCSHRERWSK